MSDETSPLGVYQDHLAKGELAYQATEDGQPVFYPRVAAPGTGSAKLDWKVSKGLGTVHTTTTLFPRNGEPYDVSLIDMDEGFRLMSRVENVAPMDVKIGMRVKVRIIPGTDDAAPYPVFDPVE